MFITNVLKIVVLFAGVFALWSAPEVIIPHVLPIVTCSLLYIQTREQRGANEKQTEVLVEFVKKIGMQIGVEISDLNQKQTDAIQKQMTNIIEMVRNFNIGIEAQTRQQAESDEKQITMLTEIARNLDGELIEKQKTVSDELLQRLDTITKGITIFNGRRNSSASESSSNSSSRGGSSSSENSTSGKVYTGRTLAVWQKFKQLFDEKREVRECNQMEMFVYTVNEINDMGTGTVSYSRLENFYKRKTKPSSDLVDSVDTWVKQEGCNNSETKE